MTHDSPHHADDLSLRKTLADLGDAHGFAMLGIAAVEPSKQRDYVMQWLSDGKHGTMDYLAKNIDLRLDAKQMVPDAKAVICVADRYHITHEQTIDTTQPTGKIARYAWGDDYHKVMKKRLQAMADQLRDRWPGHVFRAAVDTAPLLERELSLTAGLGWIGKNTMLIHPRLGSYLLLGEIITTLPIEDAPVDQTIADHCGSCTRCIDACPTDCLTPYQMDASRCISYLTIEHRDMIAPDMHEAMGDWVAGCDICQEVCPYNDAARVTSFDPPAVRDHYHLRPPGPTVPLMTLLNWDTNARQKSLIRSALKRIKLDQWKRNALIAAGNWLKNHPQDTALKQRIASIANDEAEPNMVRKTAKQILK